MSRFILNADKVAESDKAAATVEANKWFAEEVAKGFESQGGIKLGLSESDVTLLTGNFILSKEAAALELPVPPVFDTEGTAWELSIEELTGLMLEYGQHRAALSIQYALKKNNVEE